MGQGHTFLHMVPGFFVCSLNARHKGSIGWILALSAHKVHLMLLTRDLAGIIAFLGRIRFCYSILGMPPDFVKPAWHRPYSLSGK